MIGQWLHLKVMTLMFLSMMKKMMRWTNIKMMMNILPKFIVFKFVEHPEIHAVVHSCCKRDTDQDFI